MRHWEVEWLIEFVKSNSKHTGSIGIGSEGVWGTAPDSAAAHLALEYTSFVCFCPTFACFFAELFLTANLGSERSIWWKIPLNNFFLLCIEWWKPHSTYGWGNAFLEIIPRFGHSCFCITFLIILDIKCSWRWSEVGCDKIVNFSWQRKVSAFQ